MRGSIKVDVDGGAGRIESRTKKAVLKELEDAFFEAKEINDGKKTGLTLEQILPTK